MNYHDINELISETDKLYARIIAKGGRTKLKATKDKILEAREWTPSLPFIDKNFDQILAELNFFYVPKQMPPGPCFVFPLLSLDGAYHRAQTKPLEGSLLAEKGKYCWIGEKKHEPSWLGNSPKTLAKIIELRAAMLVEGPFDLLACKLLAPDLPILCPLTKYIGTKHVPYLRMLGVEYLPLMFDNERPKDEEHDDGHGNIAMKMLARQITTMKIDILRCPSEDPSTCLKSLFRAKELKGQLHSIFE